MDADADGLAAFAIADDHTAQGSFETTAEQTLGSYRLRLWSGKDMVGQAELFRLEEYVRPEFEVRVELPIDDEGQRDSGERRPTSICSIHRCGLCSGSSKRRSSARSIAVRARSIDSTLRQLTR